MNTNFFQIQRTIQVVRKNCYFFTLDQCLLFPHMENKRQVFQSPSEKPEKLPEKCWGIRRHITTCLLLTKKFHERTSNQTENIDLQSWKKKKWAKTSELDKLRTEKNTLIIKNTNSKIGRSRGCFFQAITIHPLIFLCSICCPWIFNFWNPCRPNVFPFENDERRHLKSHQHCRQLCFFPHCLLCLWKPF